MLQLDSLGIVASYVSIHSLFCAVPTLTISAVVVTTSCVMEFVMVVSLDCRTPGTVIIYDFF